MINGLIGCDGGLPNSPDPTNDSAKVTSSVEGKEA